jgi:poly(A) polymerase
MPALQDAIDEAFNARIGDVSGRGKLGIDMREIWSMQPRFEKRTGNAPYSLLDQPRFRAGFDFLRLRGVIGEIDPALAQWWETFSTAYDDERHDMVEALRQSQLKKPQTPRVRVKRPATPADDASGVEGVSSADSAAQMTAAPGVSPAGIEGLEPAWQEGDAAPAKKRRRRKKPASRSAEGADSAQGGQGAESAQGDSSAQSSTRPQSSNEVPPAPGAFAPASDY